MTHINILVQPLADAIHSFARNYINVYMYTTYRHWDVVWPQCHESVLRHKRTWKWEIYFDMIIYLHALLEKVEDFERISMSSMILLSKRTIKNLTTQWIRSIWRRKKKQNIPKLKTAKKITNEKRLFFCFFNEFTTEFSHSLTLLCFALTLSFFNNV